MADYRTIGKDQLERENLASQSARDIFSDHEPRTANAERIEHHE